MAYDQSHIMDHQLVLKKQNGGKSDAILDMGNFLKLNQQL